MNAAEDMAAHERALSHVLGELKRFELRDRVASIEVSARGFMVAFEPTLPTQQKKSRAELALEQAAVDESIMYGSAGT